jgi:hypothetical protein
MVHFQTKNMNSGKFWNFLQWKMFGIFRDILSILRPNGIFYGHLVHFVVFGIFLPVWACCTEKNLATLPATSRKKLTVRIENFPTIAAEKNRQI